MHYITCTLLAQLSFSIAFACIRILSEKGLNSFQISFVFIFASLWCILPWVWRQEKGFACLKTKKIPLLGLRGLLEFIAFSLSVYSITFIPLPAFSALGFTNPILTAILAIFVLREKSDRHDWLALLGGFIGVMVIIRPSDAGLEFEVLYRILSVITFAFCGIIIKQLTKTETVIKIVFYDALFFALFAAPLAFIYWQPLSTEDWLLLAFVGILSFSGQIFIAKAFERADLTKIMPFYFVELIFSSILAYVIFEELITVWTIIGAAIIIKSALYCGYKSKPPRKKTSVTP